MSERLQKVMAAAGIGSRRACEEYIRQGRVTVNGERAQLGIKVDRASDEIKFDSHPIGRAEAAVYVALHKPVGVLSSLRSQGGRPTVDSLVDLEERVYPVGRLDADSEGLILLTNDGQLTHRLTHPSYRGEKEYRVRLDRPLESSGLEPWRRGLRVPGLGMTAPAEVNPDRVDRRWLRVIMHEGMNREIRRIAQHLGYQVERLIRVRMETLRLGELPVGEWRQLTMEEVGELRASVDLPARPDVARAGEMGR
jgi:23S rRNA pseudouridine2605 synthase